MPLKMNRMKKYLLVFTSFTLIIVQVSSCRKKRSPSPALMAKYTGCRISQIIQTDVDTTQKIVYTFSYNGDGTVSKISCVTGTFAGNNYVKSITYKKGCVLVSQLWGGAATIPEHTDSIILDGQNRAISVFHNDVSGFNNQLWDEYRYDSSGNMVLYTNHNYNTVSTANYYWKNGDLQWNTSGTDLVSYLYDTGLYNIGNISARITDFVNYGRSIYPASRHLHSKAIVNNADTSIYTYTVDGSGKLTYVNLPGSLTQRTWITYSCE